MDWSTLSSNTSNESDDTCRGNNFTSSCTIDQDEVAKYTNFRAVPGMLGCRHADALAIGSSAVTKHTSSYRVVGWWGRGGGGGWPGGRCFP